MTLSEGIQAQERGEMTSVSLQTNSPSSLEYAILVRDEYQCIERIHKLRSKEILLVLMPCGLEMHRIQRFCSTIPTLYPRQFGGPQIRLETYVDELTDPIRRHIREAAAVIVLTHNVDEQQKKFVLAILDSQPLVVLMGPHTTHLFNLMKDESEITPGSDRSSAKPSRTITSIFVVKSVVQLHACSDLGFDSLARLLTEQELNGTACLEGKAKVKDGNQKGLIGGRVNDSVWEEKMRELDIGH